MLLANISLLRKRLYVNKLKFLPYLTNKLYKSSSNEWKSDLVRSTFIEYYKNKHHHTYYKSSPVVPLNDPSLLFINAGMNQFKSIFLGICDPNTPLYSFRRVVNSQKCIRAGGKHNDLDDVGKDCYHHTFFEMLGTWSFGNYFKKEAISMTYDILVNIYKLDPSRLYVSYFGGDDSLNLKCDIESRDYWLNFFPENRVLPFDKQDNFWEMGNIGIYYSFHLILYFIQNISIIIFRSLWSLH
jgi:alanyl-tRNA synthetase